jgi:uncharacterized membrane protein YhaH (DUF805 family)
MPDSGMDKDSAGFKQRLREIYGRFKEELPTNFAHQDNERTGTENPAEKTQLRQYLESVKNRAAESMHLDVNLQEMREQVQALGPYAQKLWQQVQTLAPYVREAGSFCLDKVLRAGVFVAGWAVVARNKLEPWARETWTKTADQRAHAQIVAGEKYAQAKAVAGEKYVQAKANLGPRVQRFHAYLGAVKGRLEEQLPQGFLDQKEKQYDEALHKGAAEAQERAAATKAQAQPVVQEHLDKLQAHPVFKEQLRRMETYVADAEKQAGPALTAKAKAAALQGKALAARVRVQAVALKPQVLTAGHKAVHAGVKVAALVTGVVYVARQRYAPQIASAEKFISAKSAAAVAFVTSVAVLTKTQILQVVRKVREPKSAAKPITTAKPAELSAPTEQVVENEVTTPVEEVTPSAVVTSTEEVASAEFVTPTEEVTVTPTEETAPVETVSPVPPVMTAPLSNRVVLGILVPVKHVGPVEQLRTLLQEELPASLSVAGIKAFFAYKERLSRRHLFAQIWLTGALCAVLMIVFLVLGKIMFGQSAGNEHLPEMTMLLFLPLALAGIKGLALIEQRLHDLNLSAWDILVFFAIFGVLVFLILCAIVGDMYKFMALICWITFFYVAVGVIGLVYTRGTMGTNTYGAPSFVLPDLDPWRHLWSQLVTKDTWLRLKQFILTPSAWQLKQRCQHAKTWIKQEYFTYQGRLNRKSYFYRVSYILAAALTVKLVLELCSVIFLAFMNTNGVGTWALWKQADHLFSVLAKTAVVLLACCQVGPEIKRLHDQGNSGWWALLALVPGVNLVYWLRQYCCRGDRGSNAYGHDSVIHGTDDEY